MNHLFKNFKSTTPGLIFGIVALLFFANTARASTFSVDSTTDTNLTVCSAAPADCSLRGAMSNANSNPGADTIAFNIPGSGYKTIAPASALPTLTDSGTFIDGNSQPGYVNAPRVVLSGAQAPTFGTDGLNITTSNCRVRGLTFQNWRSAIAISGTGAHSNTIEGCFIGTDATGLDAPGETRNIRGITLIDGAHDNIIGGVKRNVISGNGESGIMIRGTGSDRNSVAGNIIGLNARGELLSRLVGNGIGIRIDDGARHCLIGSPDVALRNFISSNRVGVQVDSAQTAFHTLVNNYIGTDPTGNKAGFGNAQAGVSINDAHSNRIGVPGAPRNIISGNGDFSDNFRAANNIELRSSHRNIIQNNFIGLKADGSGPVLAPITTNTIAAGIFLDSYSTALPSESNLIGGTEPGARNVISGNIRYGICLFGAVGTRIQGNFIGTNPSGTAAIPNTLYGIYDFGNGTLIGGQTPQARNVISGNGINPSDPFSRSGGILAAGPNGIVQGNFIGTDARGTQALPNQKVGVYIARPILVGGATSRPGIGAGNLISGNTQTGIAVDSSGSTSTSSVRVLGNLIGTDVSGTAALPNGIGIILYTGQNTAIGNGQPSGRNIISGNRGSGVQFESLSGTSGGIPRNNRIQGNFIGTDISGQKAIPNVFGVRMRQGSLNVVGGATNRPGSGAGNIISGNFVAGVFVERDFNVQPAIYGNAIGVAADGITPLPNKKFTLDETEHEGAGILAAQFVIIGGPNTNPGVLGSLGNLIAYNEGAGVRVSSGQPAIIRANSIFANGALGIDQGEVGVTPRLFGDTPTGPGFIIPPFPLLHSATQSAPGAPLIIQGTAETPPGQQIVDVFASDQPDPSGFGEGKTYLSSFNLGSPPSGFVTFNQSIAVTGNLRGKFITTTMTGVAYGSNTSEFSKALFVTATQGEEENSSSSINAVAYSSNASVVIAFDTRLQGIALENVTAKVNGQSVPVQSATINGQLMTILLPEASFAHGDIIEIFWRDLQAGDGRNLTGNTPPLAAE